MAGFNFSDLRKHGALGGKSHVEIEFEKYCDDLKSYYGDNELGAIRFWCYYNHSWRTRDRGLCSWDHDLVVELVGKTFQDEINSYVDKGE